MAKYELWDYPSYVYRNMEFPNRKVEMTANAMALIEEVKRRHVPRVGIAYCVIGWIVLQLGAFFVGLFHLPQWIIPMLLYMGMLGFPLVILFTWTYEYTAKGFKRTRQNQSSEPASQETRSTLNKLITYLLGLALILVLAERYFPLLEYKEQRSPIHLEAGE